MQLVMIENSVLLAVTYKILPFGPPNVRLAQISGSRSLPSRAPSVGSKQCSPSCAAAQIRFWWSIRMPSKLPASHSA